MPISNNENCYLNNNSNNIPLMNPNMYDNLYGSNSNNLNYLNNLNQFENLNTFRNFNHYVN